MTTVNPFVAVQPQPGRPLYQSVRDAVRDAIDAGRFAPGDQIPSTKELSERMSVSLVTAHRALQELVTEGVLQREQGKGTFVHARYLERKSAPAQTRIGLLIHRDTSIGDFYHGQIFEGLRQAANQQSVDLMLLRFGEEGRAGCTGYLFINPLRPELEAFVGSGGRRVPLLVVGARSHLKSVSYIDVDNLDVARQAVEHLAALGHRRIGYVGGSDTNSNSRDRWAGFRNACRALGDVGVRRPDEYAVRGEGWRQDARARNALLAMLSAADRPTAIFAAGYYFALDVYAAAGTLGLKIPEDLSVVGVDDPPSAAHLSPPLTTVLQPLVELGHVALNSLVAKVRSKATDCENTSLHGELVTRHSSSVPTAAVPLPASN